MTDFVSGIVFTLALLLIGTFWRIRTAPLAVRVFVEWCVLNIAPTSAAKYLSHKFPAPPFHLRDRRILTKGTPIYFLHSTFYLSGTIAEYLTSGEYGVGVYLVQSSLGEFWVRSEHVWEPVEIPKSLRVESPDTHYIPGYSSKVA